MNLRDSVVMCGMPMVEHGRMKVIAPKNRVTYVAGKAYTYLYNVDFGTDGHLAVHAQSLNCDPKYLHIELDLFPEHPTFGALYVSEEVAEDVLNRNPLKRMYLFSIEPENVQKSEKNDSK